MPARKKMIVEHRPPTTPQEIQSVRPAFKELLRNKWAEGKFVCVGLDPDPKLISQDQIFDHLKQVINGTAPYAAAFKPNSAFYEGTGEDGVKILTSVIGYIHDNYPDVPVILDAKRADIGETNKGYVEALKKSGADAITVQPYFGVEAMRPFLDKKNKGVIVLAKTSNKGSGEFQDRLLLDDELEKKVLDEGVADDVTVTMGELRKQTLTLYKRVAKNVAENWNYNDNCMLVVGATYTKQLAEIRALVGDSLDILIPGIGRQGGDLEASVLNGIDGKRAGILINSSSGITHAEREEGESVESASRRAVVKLHNGVTDVMKKAA